MTWFKPHNLLDRTFEVGIALKGINAAFELIGGVLLFAIPPQHINRLVTALTQSELSEDPHDFIASHVGPALTAERCPYRADGVIQVKAIML